MTKQIIRCSNLDRIINCSHSLLLPVEENDSNFAKLGREQHNLAAKYLNNELLDYKNDSSLDKNTITYIEYVLRLEGERFIEVQKQINLVYFILKGKADAVALKDNFIEVVDLKSGFADVLPLSNQLKGYGLIWGLQHFSAYDFFKENICIRLTIVQNNQIKSITLSFKDVIKLERLIMDSINKHTYSVGAHCQYCPSKIHCKKLVNSVTLERGNTEKTIKMVRNKSLIEKMLNEQKDYLLKNKPKWFDRKTRKLKYWIDESKAPVGDRKLLIPAAALKINESYMSNIKLVDSYSYQLKENLDNE